MDFNSKFGFQVFTSSILISDSPHPSDQAGQVALAANFTKSIYFTISSTFILIPADMMKWVISAIKE